MTFRNRGYTPRSILIAEYWVSEVSEARRLEIVSKYSGSRDKKIFFPTDIKKPHCFACNIPSLQWDRKLERCHIIPWSLTQDQSVSNFVLMCRDCHRASPTIKEEAYLWNWMASRRRASELLQDEVLCFVTEEDLTNYLKELSLNNENPSICCWFDMFMLERLGKLTEVIPVQGEMPLSSKAVVLSEIIKSKKSGLTPSDIFTESEMIHLYNSFQSGEDDFLEDVNNEDYTETDYDSLMDRFVLIYESRRLKYLSQDTKQQGLFDYAI